MLIEVTQDDIDKGQAANSGLSRGASCPIARAVARTLGVPLTRVYTGNSTVEVTWSGVSASGEWQGILHEPYGKTFYVLDAKAESFIAQADNADGHGCSGSDSPRPTTLVLRQHPLHCSINFTC